MIKPMQTKYSAAEEYICEIIVEMLCICCILLEIKFLLLSVMSDVEYLLMGFMFEKSVYILMMAWH